MITRAGLVWLSCLLIIDKYSLALQLQLQHINVFDEKHSLLMTEDDVENIMFQYNISSTDTDVPISLQAKSSDEKIFTVLEENVHLIKDDGNFTVKIKALFLGRAKLKFYSNETISATSVSGKRSGEWNEMDQLYDVIVKREDNPINTVFTAIVIVLVCVANIAMGCKTELQVVKETLKTPIAPVTGLLSQFILMPMISFVVGRALGLSSALAFGFFAMGASPGGAASNIYTFLLDGEVSLSVTMTFVSTVSSLCLIPLWLYTLGIHVIYSGIQIKIPFVNIITSLVGLMIPVGIGMLIAKYKPRAAKIILMLVRPITVIFVILVFTVGVYANLYVFQLLTPSTLLSGALIPYCGFLFGGTAAFIASVIKKWEDKRSKILTIAIETGIQNTGISIVLLQTSLPAPDNDIGIVAPIVCSIFTPIPMVIAIVSYEIYKRCYKKQAQNEEKEFSNITTDVNINGDATLDTSLSVQPLTWEKRSSEGESSDGEKQGTDDKVTK